VSAPGEKSCDHCGEPHRRRRFCSARCQKAAYRLTAKDQARCKAWNETPEGKYSNHKTAAGKRGIEWEFTFDTWWAMWEPHWDKRGNGGDKLCMCRRGDRGPYSPENCRIDTNRNNILEARIGRPCANRPARVPNKIQGVNWRKSTSRWVAAITSGGAYTHLGYYLDWFEAVCARKSAENRREAVRLRLQASDEDAIEWARTAKLPSAVKIEGGAAFGKGVQVLCFLKALKRYSEQGMPAYDPELAAKLDAILPPTPAEAKP